MAKQSMFSKRKEEAPKPAILLDEPSEMAVAVAAEDHPAADPAPDASNPVERPLIGEREAVNGALQTGRKVVRIFVGVPTKLALLVQELAPEDMTVGEALVKLASAYGSLLPAALNPALAGRPWLHIQGDSYDRLCGILGKSVSTDAELFERLDVLHALSIEGATAHLSAYDLEMIEARITTGESLATFLPRLVSEAVLAFTRGELLVPEPLEGIELPDPDAPEIPEVPEPHGQSEPEL